MADKGFESESLINMRLMFYKQIGHCRFCYILKKKTYFNTRNQNLLNHHDFAALWWRHILCKLSCFVARLSSIFGRASSIILVPILLYHSLTFWIRSIRLHDQLVMWEHVTNEFFVQFLIKQHGWKKIDDHIHLSNITYEIRK